MAEFWGTLCGCTSVTPSSRSGIWDHCEFLRSLGLSFYPYLGFFVCLSHGCLVHPFHLRSHLKKHDLHKAIGMSTLNKSGWTELISHIEKSFGVIINPDNPPKYILPSHWSMIDVPVPGLPLILGFKCSTCGWLLGTEDSFKTHRTKHNKSQKLQVPGFSSHTPSNHSYSRVYVQKLFHSGLRTCPPQLFANSLRCYIQVMNPSKTTIFSQPSALETQFSSHSAPPLSTLPPYISTLGWVEWLQSTQLSPTFLRWLVALPLTISQEANMEDKSWRRLNLVSWKLASC